MTVADKVERKGRGPEATLDPHARRRGDAPPGEGGAGGRKVRRDEQDQSLNAGRSQIEPPGDGQVRERRPGPKIGHHHIAGVETQRFMRGLQGLRAVWGLDEDEPARIKAKGVQTWAIGRTRLPQGGGFLDHQGAD